MVAAGIADKCEIQLAYAIGVAKPVSIMADTFGTGKITDDEIANLIEKNFDLRPACHHQRSGSEETYIQTGRRLRATSEERI